MVHIEQVGEVFELPLNMTLSFTDKREVQVVVPVTDRIVDFPVPFVGTLRSAEVSRDDPSLAEIVKN